MILTQNLSNQQIIESIKNAGVPVIIFGTRSVGEALFYACCEAGVKVECFCDNSASRTKDLVCGVEVVHVPNLKNKYQDAVFLISAADIKDVVEQLRSLGFSKWYPCGLLLKDFDIYQYKFSLPMDFVEYTVSTCLLCHDGFLTPDKLFLRSVDIIITERCSLKCRDCSNLTQYYKNPKDCDVEGLIQSIGAFCNIINEVNEFRVIGAEPFMNQNFDLIIKRLVSEPKIKKIVIYTNGTILPPDEKIECLQNDKILFIITDYGPLSRNLGVLTQKLSDNDIAFYVQRAQGWTDCGKIERHYRSPEQQRETFKNCCTKNTITISNGKLYRCPFAANAARLMAVPNHPDDYVNFLQQSRDTGWSREIKDRIRAYLLEKDFLETCDFCNGRPFDAVEMVPAIQTNKPLEYKQYN